MFKILATILIPYCFVLSVMPCGDQLVEFFEQHSDHQQAHEMTSLLEHDHEHKNHVDLCYPFCKCKCCSTPVSIGTTVLLTEKQIDKWVICDCRSIWRCMEYVSRTVRRCARHYQ